MNNAIVLVVAIASVSCAKPASKQAALYHCPMHPTYVSETPGDCPICGMRLVPVGEQQGDDEPKTHGGQAPKGKYVCPMAECGIASDEPGRCPKCGMDLVPAGEAAPEGMAEVAASGEGLRLLGVQRVQATHGRLERTVRAVGHVTVDETRIHRVHTKVAGFVERLYVNQTGQVVRKGEKLLDIYSPELLASQEEYLRALEAARRFARSSLPEVQKGGQDLLEAARRRLELFDVPASFVEAIERTGRPRKTVTLLAPASGVVTMKAVFEGQRVGPETELLTITDLSRVWVEADLFENEAKGLVVGQAASVSLSYDPTVRLEARVAFIDPTLNTATRTIQVRIEVENRDGRLRPGTFANVEMALEAMEGLLVPDTAIMSTGDSDILFVAKEGRFVPRQVTVALRAGGKALVSEGLAEGEEVAATAAFLLDSESRIRSAALGQGKPAGHEGHGP